MLRGSKAQDCWDSRRDAEGKVKHRIAGARDTDAEGKVKQRIAGIGHTDAEVKVKHRNAGTGEGMLRGR
jgi:hypothetical protein